MKNDPLCIKEDVCDMAVCDGVSSCSHAVLKTAVLVQQTTNTARAKSAPDIVESNSPCDYCKIRGVGSCMECYISVHQHNFIGRRLSPVA